MAITMQAPRQRSLRQGDRSPATRRLLALRTALTRIPPCHLFLVASSLLPCLARLARLSALCSAFCRLSLFPLERFCGLGHRWCGVDCRRSRHRLVRVVFVKQADELFKVLDH